MHTLACSGNRCFSTWDIILAFESEQYHLLSTFTAWEPEVTTRNNSSANSIPIRWVLVSGLSISTALLPPAILRLLSQRRESWAGPVGTNSSWHLSFCEGIPQMKSAPSGQIKHTFSGQVGSTFSDLFGSTPLGQTWSSDQEYFLPRAWLGALHQHFLRSGSKRTRSEV